MAPYLRFMRSYQFIWERVNIAGLDVRRLVLRWGMAGALKPGSCFLLQEIFLRLETFDPQPHTNLTSVAFPLFEETFSGNHREIFDHHLLEHFCNNINTSRIQISAHLFCDCWYHGGITIQPLTNITIIQQEKNQIFHGYLKSIKPVLENSPWLLCSGSPAKASVP